MSKQCLEDLLGGAVSSERHVLCFTVVVAVVVENHWCIVLVQKSLWLASDNAVPAKYLFAFKRKIC